MERVDQYGRDIGIEDDAFLDEISREQQIIIMGAFVMALRGGRFSNTTNGILAESNIRGAVLHVL